MVANGPDDCDKEPCDCLKTKEELKMGQELMKYPSKSKPGKYYTVMEPNGGGDPYCDCWQWKRNRTCQHLKDYHKGVQPTQHKVSHNISATGTEKDIDDTIDNIINKFSK